MPSTQQHSTTAVAYVVQRNASAVVIAEQPAGASATQFDKRTAWERAQRLAAAAPKAPQVSRRAALPIQFVNINGEARVVGHGDGSRSDKHASERRSSRRRNPVATEIAAVEVQLANAHEASGTTFGDVPPAQQPEEPRVLAVNARPTEKQLALFNRLAAEKGLPTIPAFAPHITRQQASDGITGLRKMDPVQLPPREDFDTKAERIREGAPFVEKGYYAVEHEGTLKFYRVGKRGFLSVQASNEFYPVRSPETRAEVKRLIAADPAAAQQRYGQHIGRCGVCNRTLTDEESRRVGIGPVCRNL